MNYLFTYINTKPADNYPLTTDVKGEFTVVLKFKIKHIRQINFDNDNPYMNYIQITKNTLNYTSLPMSFIIYRMIKKLKI